MEEKKIVIIDHYPIIRTGLQTIISNRENLNVCGDTASAKAVFEIIDEHHPDLIIIDPSLKDGCGIQFIKDLIIYSPKVTILVFSRNVETIYVDFVLKAGALGYVIKSDGLDDILMAIEKVLQGEIFVSEAIRVKLLKRLLSRPERKKETPIELLSSRELEVFQLLGEGYSTRVIAEELGLGVKTIETYRFNIKKKLVIKDNTQLIQQAVRWANTIDRKI